MTDIERPSHELRTIKHPKEEGRLKLHPKFASKYLSTRRDIIVYLPPGYFEGKDRHPVLYLQDGQNLFDPGTAFCGQHWCAGETADAMVSRGEIDSPILVGIYNTGRSRMSEYAPTRDRKFRKGGKADRYAEMLAREIKPFIDHEYRTRKAAKHTAVGGSSLGGLASLVAGLHYPRVFGQSVVISPSVWWDNRAILQFVNEFTGSARPRVWLDIGTAEGDSPERIVEDTRALHRALLEKGWRENMNLTYHEFHGATHSESAWAARFGAILAWLFGKQSAQSGL